MSELDNLLDEHEIAYVTGKRGTMPDDTIAEAIRQYRAINKANKRDVGASPVTPSELDRLVANEPEFPKFEPLHRKEGDRPIAHLSEQGAPYQPYYGHMPAGVHTPHFESPPTKRFKEGLSDSPLEQLKLSAGGLYNKASDLYKGLFGSIADPEVAMQPPLAAGLLARRLPKLSKAPKESAATVKPSELERLATEAPQAPDMVTVYRGEGTIKRPIPDWVQQGLKENGSLDAQGRWWTTDKSIADWYAKDAGEGGRVISQDIPRSVADAAKVVGKPEARFSLDPENELYLPKEYASGQVPPIKPPELPQAPRPGVGESLPSTRRFGGPPARIEPPEPPERLGADGTWRFEPWRQNYDVYVSDWRDPNLSAWEKFKRRLPADYSIATKHPESPVIGVLDRPSTQLMNFTDEFVRSPEMKELSKLDADLFVTEEAKAYAMWEQSRRAAAETGSMIPPQPGQRGLQVVGLSPEATFAEIMEQIDPRVRPWFELFRQRMAIDQQSRAILGLEAIDEVPYPYLPRIGQADWDRLMMLQRGNTQGDAVSQLSTTIKGFQQARTYPTMSEGLRRGMMYEDPKRAIIMRLVLSKQLEYTAQMMQELRGRVLFESRNDARGELLRRRDPNRQVLDTIMDPTHTRAMATGREQPVQAPGRLVQPLGEPVAVTGLPGPADKIWFVPSKDEALALFQHLKGRQSGGIFGETSMAVNQLFRNPNLMNPAPHVIKNMGYKYVIAATGLGQNPLGALGSLGAYALRMPFDFFGVNAPVTIGRLSRDATEYAQNLNPALIAEFNREMPFSRTAATAYENLRPFLERSKPWEVAQILGKYLTGNAWSSKYIFSKADPAMKYSLWKMYREKGMTGTAAANQVNIDLIRYTLRSDLTDTWKNVPLNFFVPWRVGTVMATAKQLSMQPWKTLALQQATKIPLWALTRPFKTSLLIGAIMLGREAYYRETGKTFHLPIDYIDGPMAQVVTNGMHGALNVAASMYLLGPGGDVARIAKQVGDMFGVLKGTEDFSKLMEMYWGIAQIYGSGEAFYQFAKSLDEKGVEGADYSALAHVIMGAAAAEYTTYGYQPKHLEHYLSDDMLPWNPAVKRNITENEARAAAAELRKPGRDLRKQKIKELQEKRVRP